MLTLLIFFLPYSINNEQLVSSVSVSVKIIIHKPSIFFIIFGVGLKS